MRTHRARARAVRPPLALVAVLRRYKAELRRRVRDAYTPRRSPERRASSFGFVLRVAPGRRARHVSVIVDSYGKFAIQVNLEKYREISANWIDRI